MTQQVKPQLRSVPSNVLTGSQLALSVPPSIHTGVTVDKFVQSMRNIKLSPYTIRCRVELINRLQAYLDGDLLAATTDDLIRFQSTYAHLSVASVHVYSRHIRAYYKWARRSGLIAIDPALDIDLPRLPKGRPHPTSFDDLRTIFACAPDRLRTAYVLAAFAGLRCGEICRLHSRDLDYEHAPTALIHGKGGKTRTVPILAPVLDEIRYVRGWIIKTADGRQVRPDLLSADSTRFLHGIGMDTTLHSMRGTFATHAIQLTHDVLLVRDLLGHESVSTTEIYTLPDHSAQHQRLAGFTDFANGVMRLRHLTAVGGA
jgi:integrase